MLDLYPKGGAFMPRSCLSRSSLWLASLLVALARKLR